MFARTHDWPRYRWLVLAVLVGCGSGETSRNSFLDAPRGALPATMTELGLYPSLAEGNLAQAHPALHAYRPAHELWSNGSDKQRFMYLPPGQKVDNTDRASWQFPEGTAFFKTFSYPSGEALPSKPVETRVLRRTDVGWDYAVYLWDATGTEATLWDPARTVQVPVAVAGEAFVHEVPAKLDCRKCHESQEQPVIGFDEVRLNAPIDAATVATQLETLAARSIFTAPMPADPARVVHEDARTQQVLAYFLGNCTHCHNGREGASASFDMRPAVALANLIGKQTEGEALAGIRVVAGNPDESALYRAMTRNETLKDIQPMPPVGVQRVDAAAVKLIRDWIMGLGSSIQ